MKSSITVCFVTALLGCNFAAAELLTVHLRTRDPDKLGSKDVIQAELTAKWKPEETAIVVCDMWDQHWCKGATARVAEMAPRMNEVLKSARRHGVLIIHCPSTCMEAYKETPQRRIAQSAPKIDVAVPLSGWCNLDSEREGRLPIDDTDGGCDCDVECQGGSPWKRQIASLHIAPADAITDSEEAFYLMKERGVKNVIVMGVHMNMCVLGRPFAIRQLVKQGMNVALMRDMSDTMYDHRQPPYVSHFRGNELVVEHIERFWCPSVASTDFTGKPEFVFAADTVER